MRCFVRFEQPPYTVLPDVDAITDGHPCTQESVASQRLGFQYPALKELVFACHPEGRRGEGSHAPPPRHILDLSGWARDSSVAALLRNDPVSALDSAARRPCGALMYFRAEIRLPAVDRQPRCGDTQDTFTSSCNPVPLTQVTASCLDDNYSDVRNTGLRDLPDLSPPG